MANLTITKIKIIIKNGKSVEAILQWKDFQEILERIEDFYDLATIQKINKKPAFKNLDSVLGKYAL